jgi:uncharacterized protein HemX
MKRTADHTESGHAILYAVLAIVVVAAVGLSAWRIHKHHQTQKSATTAASSTTSNTAVSAPLAPGSNNSSLQSDLTNINGSLTQQTADQNASNTAINDQQSEISVPTN